MSKLSSPKDAAEHLSNPIEFYDHDGNIVVLRTFLWMKHYGVLDDITDKVIVPAISRNRSIHIFPNFELIVGGSPDDGWQVYSLNGDQLVNYGPMSINKLEAILKNWGR